MVLFKQAVGDAFGVLVDEIGDVVSVAESTIEKRDGEEGGEDASLMQGVTKCGDELLVILNAHGFLSACRIHAETA